MPLFNPGVDKTAGFRLFRDFLNWNMQRRPGIQAAAFGTKPIRTNSIKVEQWHPAFLSILYFQLIWHMKNAKHFTVGSVSVS